MSIFQPDELYEMQQENKENNLVWKVDEIETVSFDENGQEDGTWNGYCVCKDGDEANYCFDMRDKLNADKLCEFLNDTQKEILKEYYLNNKTIPWSISTEDKRIIYNNWEQIVFPNGVSRIKTVDVMIIASTIKEMRKHAGYNREEVAGILNISVATLRKYEDGKSLVRLDILVIMLQIYGSGANELIEQINFNLIFY